MKVEVNGAGCEGAQDADLVGCMDNWGARGE